MNHFDHIHTIIDAVFGPDDDSPVPAAHTMMAALSLKMCAACGTDMPPGAEGHEACPAPKKRISP